MKLLTALCLCLGLLPLACDRSADELPAETTETPASPAAVAGTARFDFVTFSRLQGYHEGVPCAPNSVSPLAGAAQLVASLQQTSDQALLICLDDTLQPAAGVSRAAASQAGTRARAEVLLEAMAAAGVDLYIPGHGDLQRFGVSGLLDRTAALGIPVLLSNLDAPGRDDVLSYQLFEAGGLTVACLGVIAAKVEGSSAEPEPGIQIAKPVRRITELADSLLSTGKADLIVVFSGLASPTNRRLADTASIHFIIGASESGQPAERIVRHQGVALMTQRQRGQEAGHTTLKIVGGEFRMIDLSPLWSLPKQLANEKQVLDEWLEQYQTDDLAVLAQRISPIQEPDLPGRLEMRAQNEQFLKDYSDYQGSYVAHRAAEYPAVPPDDPVLEVLARQAQAIRVAVEAVETPPKPLDPGSFLSAPESCARCHRDQYEHWQQTAHSRAHADLQALGRELDGSCLTCHAAGFNKGGGFKDPRLGEPYGGVSCWTCHETRSFHASLIRGATDPALMGIADWDFITQRCEACHRQRRSPDFALDQAMDLVACPPMRPDDPALAEARHKVLKAVDRHRAQGTEEPRDLYREGRALIGLGQLEKGIRAIQRYGATVTEYGPQTVELARYLDEHGASQEALTLIRMFLAKTPSEPMVNTEFVRLLLEARDEAVQDPRRAEAHIRLVAPDDGSQIKAAMLPLRMMQVEAMFRAAKGQDAFRLLHRLNTAFPRNDEVKALVDHWLGDRG